MFGFVLDCSALIPCGNKSREEKEAIRQLGDSLSDRTLEGVTVYLSTHLIKVYRTKVKPELERHHPLPPFQVSLCNLLDSFWKISKVSRGRLCKPLPTEMGINFHILESSRVSSYDVDNIGLTEEEDKEVLRIALTSTHEKTFLVTTDPHFLRNLNRIELSRKYPEESQKIEIVNPADPNFKELLSTLSALSII